MNEDHKKLWEKIKDVRVAMMTTAEPDGTLRSRPMYTQQAEFDGELWFFTKDDSGKAEEISREHHVNLSYAEPKETRYVSVSGVAEVVHNRQKAEELWHPMLKAWFNEGLDDPHLGLIRVRVAQAEYWDDTSSKMAQLVGMTKAAMTDDTYTGSENKKIRME